MYRLTCRFRTNRGKIDAGIASESELKKHFTKAEIEAYIDDGFIIPIVSDAPVSNDMTIDEMLDADKHSLKSEQLKEVCKHYGLPVSGNKDTLVARIEEFEDVLEKDTEELEGDELKAVAAYLGVDTSLEDDEMRQKIDEASEA
jgi:hypothetical protein